MVEAELANHIVPMAEILRHRDAAGGLCLSIGEGAGRRKSPGPGVRSSADCWIDVPRQGAYAVWLRAYWTGGCSNSINLRLDHGHPLTVTDALFDRWHWVRGPWLTLSRGCHLLTLTNREDGVLIDQICLAADRQAPAPGAGQANAVPTVPESVAVPPLQATLSGVANFVEKADPLFGEGASRTMETVYSAFMLPGREIQVELWLRNNAARARRVKVQIEADPRLRFLPRSGLDRTVPANGLAGIALKIALAGRTRPVALPVRIRVAPGGETPTVTVPLVLHLLPRWEKYGPVHGEEVITAYERHRNALGPGSTKGWRPFDPSRSFDQFGRFDLNAALGRSTYAVAFARMQLEAARDAAVDAYISHDDSMAVWVNGKLIYHAEYVGPASDSRSAIRLPLRKDANHVLVAVGQREHRWHFSFVPAPPPGAGVLLPSE